MSWAGSQHLTAEVAGTHNQDNWSGPLPALIQEALKIMNEITLHTHCAVVQSESPPFVRSLHESWKQV